MWACTSRALSCSASSASADSISCRLRSDTLKFILRSKHAVTDERSRRVGDLPGMESRVFGEIPEGSIEPIRVIGPARWRDRLPGSFIFNYRGEESIPTRVPDEARGLPGKGIESLMAGSPEGVFQIDDSAKRTILTNIERQPFAHIPIQPIFDCVGGGNRAVPQQRGQPYGDRLAGGLGDPAQRGEGWVSLSALGLGEW